MTKVCIFFEGAEGGSLPYGATRPSIGEKKKKVCSSHLLFYCHDFLPSSHLTLVCMYVQEKKKDKKEKKKEKKEKKKKRDKHHGQDPSGPGAPPPGGGAGGSTLQPHTQLLYSSFTHP